MVSSAEDRNLASWINTCQSVEGFDKSLDYVSSSISPSSTLSGVENRRPALSASSLSTLGKDAGQKTSDCLESTSGFSPLTPLSARSRDNNNGIVSLSQSSPNTEYEDGNHIVSPPLFAMSHISLNQCFSAPLQTPPSLNQDINEQRGRHKEFSGEGRSRSDNSVCLLKEANSDPLAANKIHQDEYNALGSINCDQLHRKHNESHNESLFCDNAKSYGSLSKFLPDKDCGRNVPINNSLEISQAHGQDHGNYDIILGGTTLNESNNDIQQVDSNVGGNRFGSGYDTSNNLFLEEGRISSTIRSNYSPLNNMGSVYEHEQFLGNRTRASSLGYPIRTGSNFDRNRLYPCNAHYQEANFVKGFQDKSSLASGEGGAEEPHNSNPVHPGHLIPVFDTLPRRSSWDEICAYHSNFPEYPARCDLPQTSPPRNNHHLLSSHCGALNQEHQRFNHPTIKKNQHVEPPRQRVMSADGSYNRCHSHFQNQELEFNFLANSSNMPPGHSSNFDEMNCAFDAQQTNRPRSYSSGTNMNEYVRSQSFRMQSPQFASGFNVNNKASHCADGSTVQHSPARNLFALNDAVHRSQQHTQENEYRNDCNYNAGRLSRNCSQSRITQRGDGMAPFDNNMPFVQDSSGSGVHVERCNTHHDAVHQTHRKQGAMNAPPQNFPSVDSLSHYQGKKNVYVYNVKFKRTQRHFILGQCMQRVVQVGSYVKVEADRGEDLGVVISCTPSDKVMSGARLSCRHPVNSGVEYDMNTTDRCSGYDISLPSPRGSRDLKRLLRLATDDEILLLVVKKEEEEELLKICEEKIVQRSLPMKVVDAEYQFDRNKLTFFFEAEGRVDFRELVRDLFSIYKTRIWMQQLDKNAPVADGSRTAENTSRINKIDVLPTDCDYKEVK